MRRRFDLRRNGLENLRRISAYLDRLLSTVYDAIVLVPDRQVVRPLTLLVRLFVSLPFFLLAEFAASLAGLGDYLRPGSLPFSPRCMGYLLH